MTPDSIDHSTDTVLVAMSGGVDSSVAAALLHQRGYRVIGMTMKLWDYDSFGGNVVRDSACCTVDSMDDARTVCEQLGVPYYVADLRREFQETVVDDFVSQYLAGRTPNPCVNCNTYMKWGVLLRRADELGADFVATGHYARIWRDHASGRCAVRKGVDEVKDQSYALWGVPQETLARTLLPIGDFEKDAIRELAGDLGLAIANKPESQDICFVPDNDYRRFLRERVSNLDEKAPPGELRTVDGETIGQHAGFVNYTVGQRKGLGVALGKAAYVVEIDPEANRVVVGDRADLRRRGLIAHQLNWMAMEGVASPVRVMAKIRYNDHGAPATIFPEGPEHVRVVFDEQRSAITPGQSVVFYDGGIVVGGGRILRSLSADEVDAAGVASAGETA